MFEGIALDNVTISPRPLAKINPIRGAVSKGASPQYRGGNKKGNLYSMHSYNGLFDHMTQLDELEDST